MKKTVASILGVCGLLVCALQAAAINTAQIYPESGLYFGTQAVGTTSTLPQTISIYNTGTVAITVNTLTITPPQFQLVSGSVPTTIAAGGYANFTLVFTPSTAQNLGGTITFTFAGLPTQAAKLFGIGTSTTAKASLSASSLSFGNQALGSAGAFQTLTVTNTGTTTFNVTGETVTQPFLQTGFVGRPITVAPNTSASLPVAFSPSLLGAAVGTLLISYDVLPNSGVSLSGTATAATGFGITSYPILPSATQSAAYEAVLTAAGGKGNLTWSLATGSSLPSGLKLSGTGVVTGTLASSVGAGGYSFTAQATDSSSPPNVAMAVLSLLVGKPTGANCSNIDWKVGGAQLVPILDLGTSHYQGIYQGGLYANGSNVDDPGHDSYGVGLGQGIGPLDANGNPSPTGKYVLLTVGQSNTLGVATEFVALTSADPSIHANLVVVNGATGGASGSSLQDPNNYFWTVITNNYLPNAGVTANQVVAVWLNDVDAQGNPPTIPHLQSELESIAQNLLLKFPNLKITYLSSVNYTGYSNGVYNLYHEPYAYEAGFAAKYSIQDQINGNANLNFDPSKGTVLAPWMAWGPYYWVDGLVPRSDGFVWSCQDSRFDGTHPSDPAGRLRASTTLMNFLKTDHTATPWFLAPTH